MDLTAERAHLRPRQEEMTHLWEANASRRNQTELSLLTYHNQHKNSPFQHDKCETAVRSLMMVKSGNIAPPPP